MISFELVFEALSSYRTASIATLVVTGVHDRRVGG